MTCAVCGAENETSAGFCYRCGSALKPATPATTGPTMTLGDRATPPLGTPVVAMDDAASNARVYEVPASGTPSAPPYQAPVTPAASGSMPLNTPTSSVPPVYNVPGNNPSTGYGAGYPTTVVPQQNNSALISMILGIVSLAAFVVLLCTIFLPPLSAAAAIPAVFLGRKAQREIQAANGQQTGGGMAQAGVIMGWINIGLSVLALCAIVGFIALGLSGQLDS